jgi:hypothetical protein
MPEEKTNVIETELEIASAEVEIAGKVTIYTWEQTAKAHHYHTWWMKRAGQVISGGIHVHGWDSVYMTDSYPLDAQSWKVGVENREGHDVHVTIYTLALT